MKKKSPGGVLGRNLKHKNKIATFGFMLVAIVLFFAIGSIYNDVALALTGGITIAGAAKFATVGLFGMRPMFYRSPDGGGNGSKTDEEILLEKIQVKLDAMKSSFGNHESISALKTQLADLDKKFTDLGVDKYKSEIERLATELTALKETGKKEEKQSVKAMIKSYLEANKDKYEAFKRGEAKAFSFDLDLKAATTMLESNALVTTTYLPNREIVPGFVDIARNQPFIENYINSSGTTSARIVWVNKVNQEGTAGMTAEGALKSQIDFNLDTEESSAKKVTDYIKISTEMLDDIDFIAAAIENELRYQVDIKVDNQLLTGDGTGQNLTGITTYASAYSLTTILTDNANNSDAIMAAATQIKSLNFMANYAFVNPIDFANMSLQKDADGNYVIPPFMSAGGLTVAGLRVVESNQIAVGYVLVADTTKYIKRDLKSFSISYGWENDDFSKNLVTILGERRLHAYCSDNNTSAFVYDTFDNIKTAITLP